MTVRGGHRVLRIVLVIVLMVVAVAVGGVALYASTSDESSGTSAAGAAATPTRSPTATPSGITRSSAPASRPPAASAPPAAPALWQHIAAPAAPLLLPVTLDTANDATTDDPTTVGLTSVLTPLLADHAFAGDDVAMLVADATTGQLLFDHDGAEVVPPASTAKLAVAVAALQVLGPNARLTTRVLQGSSPSRIVLVGGGDPTLSGPAAVGLFSPGYPTPASLTTLALQTAAHLRARGTISVSLGYDASLYVGATLAPGWKPIYQTEGDVAPVSALEVDEGHPNLAKPATATDPAAAAAGEFAALLTSDGL
ncbi:MAG TPA: D-alanyl-D-alanine carboxypeptidase, partial [Acidothermaceae bacterium]